MFGNAWAVPRNAIAARLQMSNARGRPLAGRNAWRSIIAGDVNLSNLSRFRNRGAVYRYQMSSADHGFIAEQDQAMVSGVAAAVYYEELIPVRLHEAYLYVSEALHLALESDVAAIRDELGLVVLRVVPDDLWDLAVESGIKEARGVRRMATRAAVALDLMESGDPRHWAAAERLIVSQ